MSAIILYLWDIVLRDVTKEVTATSMWSKLKSLYMTKLLAHRQFFKQQLNSFKMLESKTIKKQLTKFNKILNHLENIEDENKALV